MKYLVTEFYFDDGQTRATIIEVPDDCEPKGPISKNQCDVWQTICDTIEEAESRKNSVLNA